MIALKIIPILSLLLSPSSAQAELPDWAKDLNRKVVGGHIFFVGKGTSPSSDLAMFKAEQAAYAGIINECNGRAPAEIRIAERHEQLGDESGNDGTYLAYARAAVTFSECDEAKFGRTKENAAVKEAQDFYKALLVVDGKPELLKKVNWKETETLILKMKKDMDWEMKTYKEELKKDAEVAYAQQQAEIDSLAEEVSAMKNEQLWQAEQVWRKSKDPAKRAAAKKVIDRSWEEYRKNAKEMEVADLKDAAESCLNQRRLDHEESWARSLLESGKPYWRGEKELYVKTEEDVQALMDAY